MKKNNNKKKKIKRNRHLTTSTAGGCSKVVNFSKPTHAVLTGHVSLFTLIAAHLVPTLLCQAPFLKNSHPGYPDKDHFIFRVTQETNKHSGFRWINLTCVSFLPQTGQTDERTDSFNLEITVLNNILTVCSWHRIKLFLRYYSFAMFCFVLNTDGPHKDFISAIPRNPEIDVKKQLMPDKHIRKMHFVLQRL